VADNAHSGEALTMVETTRVETTEARATRVETITLGGGERAVLVHGDVLDAAMTWSAQQPLADEYELVLVNRRGFGASPDVDGEDFEVDARDVVEVLGPGAHLVGHSYGAVGALLAAALRPDLVRSLTVLEPPAFDLVADREDVRSFRHRIEDIVAERPEPEQFLRRFVDAVGGDLARLPSPLPPPLRKAASVQMHGRWPWEAAVPLDDIAAAAYPVLVVSGGHSAMFDAVCDVLEHRLRARRVVLSGAGHSIPMLGGPLNDALRTHWAAARDRDTAQRTP
jgi:pimeloyl-ACP methyl ester carboxylesterase